MAVPHKQLSPETLYQAASLYRVEPALLSALIHVESGGSGFLPDGRVKIRFEPHIFWRQLLSRGVDPRPLHRDHPNLCYPHWNRGHDPGSLTDQYRKIEIIREWALHHDPRHEASYVKAAWEGCSWGLFQLLGVNCESAGFPEITSFIDAHEQSEEVQLGVILQWLQGTGKMQLLRQKRWSEFVRGYNGQGQVGWYTGTLMAHYRQTVQFWARYQKLRVHHARTRFRHFFSVKQWLASRKRETNDGETR